MNLVGEDSESIDAIVEHFFSGNKNRVGDDNESYLINTTAEAHIYEEVL